MVHYPTTGTAACVESGAGLMARNPQAGRWREHSCPMPLKFLVGGASPLPPSFCSACVVTAEPVFHHNQPQRCKPGSRLESRLQPERLPHKKIKWYWATFLQSAPAPQGAT